MEESLRKFALQGVTTTGKEIGRGAYGRVLEVQYCGTLCAAKEIHNILLGGPPEVFRRMKTNFLTECCHHSELRHPNIVQFIGIYWPTNRRMPTMVMEKMDLSLRDFVEMESYIPLRNELSILHGISLGVWYLHYHDPPFMHRDLTPSNVLVNTTSLVTKICDFVVMRVASPYSSAKDDLTQAPGTVDFMAPEALSPRPSYGLPLDVFSYGGVALFTIAGEWPTPNSPVMIDPKTKNLIALTEVRRRQHYLNKIREDAAMLRILVEECLHNDPSMRPTMENVSTRIKEIKGQYVGYVEVSTYTIVAMHVF